MKRTRAVLLFSAVLALHFGCGGSSENDPDPNPMPDSGTGMPDASVVMDASAMPDASEIPDTGMPDGSDGGEDAGVDSGPTVDTTPPTILSVSPDTGETGVANDAKIVITFSEPMRKADTQAAYQSSIAGITNANVTFSWNTAGDELTITPNAPLTYQTGSDPDATIAREYTFSLTTTATDLAGNELAEQFDSNFFTLRRITQALSKLGGDTNVATAQTLTGAVRSTGTVGTSGWVGYSSTGLGLRSVFTMDLSPIPSDIVAVEQATFRIRQDVAVTGDPFGNLMALTIHDIQFDALNVDTYGLMNAGNRLGTFTELASTGYRSYDVLTSVTNDLEHREARMNRSQFGLRFTRESGINNQNDYVTYLLTSATAGYAPRLTVRYLVP